MTKVVNGWLRVKCQCIFSYLRPMLAEKPDIVIGTPSRLLAHIQAENLDIKTSLEMIVIDEADLVFSFGYEENVRAILRYNLKTV